MQLFFFKQPPFVSECARWGKSSFIPASHINQFVATFVSRRAATQPSHQAIQLYHEYMNKIQTNMRSIIGRYLRA